MKTKLVKFQPVSALLILLATITFQSACKKVEPSNTPGKLSYGRDTIVTKKEFADSIKGEWLAWQYYEENSAGDYVLSIWSDSVYWRGLEQEFTYSIHDTAICKLPKIEKLQNWTITENGNDLYLEAVDLCGHIKNYKMDCRNFHFTRRYGGQVDFSTIHSDIKLIGSDTVTLIGFVFHFNVYFYAFGDRTIDFHIKENNTDGRFILESAKDFL